MAAAAADAMNHPAALLAGPGEWQELPAHDEDDDVAEDEGELNPNFLQPLLRPAHHVIFSDKKSP